MPHSQITNMLIAQLCKQLQTSNLTNSKKAHLFVAHGVVEESF